MALVRLMVLENRPFPQQFLHSPIIRKVGMAPESRLFLLGVQFHRMRREVITRTTLGCPMGQRLLTLLLHSGINLLPVTRNIRITRMIQTARPLAMTTPVMGRRPKLNMDQALVRITELQKWAMELAMLITMVRLKLATEILVMEILMLDMEAQVLLQI